MKLKTMDRIAQKDVIELSSFLDKTYPVYRLADRLNLDYLEKALGPYYVEANGLLKTPIRVTTDLHYLKYLESESNEFVVESRTSLLS